MPIVNVEWFKWFHTNGNFWYGQSFYCNNSVVSMMQLCPVWLIASYLCDITEYQNLIEMCSSRSVYKCTVILLYRYDRYKLAFFIQFSSVTQTLCNPMNDSTPGLPVHHQLPESTQTHVHWVGDAIQPSHPLSSPSPPAPNPSQHQGLFKWVSSLH